MVALKKQKNPKDADTLQSDVASFASTLGLSSGATPSSGFNDADFRKTGPLKPHSGAPKISYPNKLRKEENISKTVNKDRKLNPRHKPKPSPVHNNSSNNSYLIREDDNRFKNLPKLPLVKSSALGVWYSDAAELEDKVIGVNKRVEFNSVEEWNVLVEKKKELGERLLVQYAREYESSRGKSGDIKMLVATQRSGTAADKVSALSVMVGDNAVANMRSVDAILGNLSFSVDDFVFLAEWQIFFLS